MIGRLLATGHNPFSTRFVRPGAIRYEFSPEITAGELVARLAAAGWQGAIIGPHGSGKSTLLATLPPAIEAAGRMVRRIALHDGQRRLPEPLEDDCGLDDRAVIVVDGYEQLSWWARCRLTRLCRRRGWGLLATAHRTLSLCTIFETRTTAELAVRLVEHLTAGQTTIDATMVAEFFAARSGNLREVLFDCYDLYERQSASPIAGQV